MKSKESFALTTGLSTREPAGLVLLRASPSGSGCHNVYVLINLYINLYTGSFTKYLIPYYIFTTI